MDAQALYLTIGRRGMELTIYICTCVSQPTRYGYARWESAVRLLSIDDYSPCPDRIQVYLKVSYSTSAEYNARIYQMLGYHHQAWNPSTEMKGPGQTREHLRKTFRRGSERTLMRCRCVIEGKAWIKCTSTS